MRAYRARKRAAGFRRVGRWVPAEADGSEVYSDHRIHEARSLAMHCQIAQKITKNPRLIDVARRNLARWAARGAEPVPCYIREWQEILDAPWPQVAAFITSFDERAVRLRQSSPFAGILTPQERRRVYDAFRA
jgi:hypothetical protein